MDVRNLVVNKSSVLNPILTEKTYDGKALAILKLVKKRITYKSDKHTYNAAEYWQHPELTWQKGIWDCEDGALLIASLMRMVGIPAYRVKVCAGWVETKGGRGGHAYVIYLADNNEWYVLDWCYYGNESISNFLVTPHKSNPKYQEIWWTFNDKYTWAQKSTMLN